MIGFVVAGVGATFTAFVSVVYWQPQWIMDILQSWYPDVLFKVKTERKFVALTIDDGPTAKTTPLILDVLKEYDVKCTFFLIGRQIEKDGNEKLIERMRNEGHELGNHTYHNTPAIALPIKTLEKQIVKVDKMLYPDSNDQPKVKSFRPGHGYFSKTMVEKAKELGYRTVLGDIYPHDPIVMSSTINSAYVLHRVHPGGIIILHDGNIGPRSGTVATLKTILPKLKEMGYEITTVANLLEQTK
jgi:peptidoglycan/xylan/chitin deacetylase (PgdA/CDA1 family)